MGDIKIRSMILSITDACNLRCKYCYVPKNTHKMSYQVAKDAIDIAAESHRKYYSEQKPTYVSFFGGEPTLYWNELIVPLVEHYKKSGELNVDVRFTLMTNGVLLNKDRIDFLRDNSITVICSVDGDKYTQNYNRPFADGRDSFDIIQNHLQYLTSSIHTSCRGTLIPETCSELYNNIQYLSQYNFQQIMYMPDWSNKGWTENILHILSNELHKYSYYFINAFHNGNIPVELSNITDYFPMLKEYSYAINSGEAIKRSCESCGLGTIAVGINYNGDIYACQELQSALSSDDIYCIGNIYTGIDDIKHKELIKTFSIGENSCEDKSVQCEDCLYKPLCNRYTCHASHYLRCGNMNSKAKIECAWDEMNLREALYIADILLTNDCKEFKNRYFKS